MTNKEIAISFLKAVALGEIDKGYTSFVSDDFIHHNQYFKGDRESLKTAMEEDHKTSPNNSIEIKTVIAEGDKVMTHSLVSKEDMEITVVHIFKIINQKITEVWDVGQVVAKDSPNENGAF